MQTIPMETGLRPSFPFSSSSWVVEEEEVVVVGEVKLDLSFPFNEPWISLGPFAARCP